MKQTALANKPDIAAAIRDNLSNPPNKQTIAVVEIMSKCSGPRIKFIEAAIFGAEPKIAATILRDALDRSTTDTISVVRVMNVASKAFGCWVKSVHPRV